MIIVKKLITMITMLFLITGTSDLASGEGAGRGIGTDQSCHNFSHEEWLPVVDICRICHVPHNRRVRGNSDINDYPDGLEWNPGAKSVIYSLYNSTWSTSLTGLRDTTWTAPFINRRGGMPDELSKLCLSCHDGIIAPDIFKLHHFVSLDYDTTGTELRDPEVTMMGVSGPITEVLGNGKIQCFSCHDPHDEEAVANTKLIRVPRDKICYLCHKR